MTGPTMTFSELVALLAFLFPLAYSPGPGNSFFAALGARAGLRGSWPALAGYHAATWLVTLAIGLGLGLTLIRDPAVARVLALAGAAYVLWLGSSALIAAGRAVHSSEDAGEAIRTPGFTAGALVLLLNPKAYLIIALMFAQFLGPGDGQVSRAVAVTSIFTANNLVAFVVWAAAGQALAALARRRGWTRSVDTFFAVCLLAVGVWLLLSAL